MNSVDLLVTGFVLLHLATLISVMLWIGRWMAARNGIGGDYELAKRKERRARIPALILVALLAACYVALFILDARLSK